MDLIMLATNSHRGDKMTCGECRHMVEKRKHGDLTLGYCYQHWMRVTTSSAADKCKKFEER